MTPEDQYDAYIKAPVGKGGWRDLYYPAAGSKPVTIDNGNRRYVPRRGARGNVWLLDPDVHAFHAAVDCWAKNIADTSLLEPPNPGFVDVIGQAGYKFTWEWALIDPARPWSARVGPTLRGFIFNHLVRRQEHARMAAVVKAVVAERAA